MNAILISCTIIPKYLNSATHAQFVFPTAMNMKSIVIWVVVPCNLEESLTFWRNISLPSSGWKYKPSKNLARKQPPYLLLISFSGVSLLPGMLRQESHLLLFRFLVCLLFSHEDGSDMLIRLYLNYTCYTPEYCTLDILSIVCYDFIPHSGGESWIYT
jgi:hypothetical protein